MSSDSTSQAGTGLHEAEDKSDFSESVMHQRPEDQMGIPAWYGCLYLRGYTTTSKVHGPVIIMGRALGSKQYISGLDERPFMKERIREMEGKNQSHPFSDGCASLCKGHRPPW